MAAQKTLYAVLLVAAGCMTAAAQETATSISIEDQLYITAGLLGGLCLVLCVAVVYLLLTLLHVQSDVQALKNVPPKISQQHSVKEQPRPPRTEQPPAQAPQPAPTQQRSQSGPPAQAVQLAPTQPTPRSEPPAQAYQPAPTQQRPLSGPPAQTYLPAPPQQRPQSGPPAQAYQPAPPLMAAPNNAAGYADNRHHQEYSTGPYNGAPQPGPQQYSSQHPAVRPMQPPAQQYAAGAPPSGRQQLQRQPSGDPYGYRASSRPAYGPPPPQKREYY